MNKKVYQQINETLYEEVLPNGLKVYLLPKADFHKTYGLFSTNYGSVDNHFGFSPEALHQVPDGIAHFLEHKLFEKEDGDVFQTFGQQGASANAFTSFTKTSYLFSATDQIKLNFETLIDFVQAPYFTEETVEKEKGIIGQEIQMYDDDPNWQQFFGIIKNLYPKHPLHIDIAGTVESIAQITAEDLYLCYNTFYHPSNMTLFVVGNIDPEETMAWIRTNQAAKTFPETQAIIRQFPEETFADIQAESSLTMPVTRAKGVLGIKGDLNKLPKSGRELLRFKNALNLFCQLVLGNTSANYLRLYDQGIIDDTFGFEVNLDRGFYFADFSGDSEEPEKMLAEIEAIVMNFQQDPEINEENLTLLKKKMLGKYFQSLNSLEFIANQFTQSLFGETTLFDLPEVIQSITLEDVQQAARSFIDPKAFSRFYMYPTEKA
ncbi:insulinase family protein [Enterococcus casseliflavus]|uniref:EF-P 5-aminopentanol modification-associated protein YfmH n=1 Tax=Enterococcus casseliflavus TaxID=37734 RepID=UPI00129CAAC4|nr:pitrilysin family protein [Enterococcus casseliflavus]MBZ3641914.1 insulinase family protein [Enterococcus casseliflavus]MRI71578.1 insulinase family protein [Enterococcus casseliflavus]